MAVARSIRCGSCGGHAPLVGLVPSFPCPFCRSTLVVPAELLRELGAYGEAVSAAHDEARKDVSLAAQYEMWTSPEAYRKSTILALVVGLGVPVVTGLVGSALMKARVLPAVMEPLVGVVTMVVSFGALGGYFVYMYRRQHRSAALAQAPVTVCPQCGAPNALLPGAPATACRYCRAPMVPSPTVMRDVVADAQAAARRARIERRRAERAMMANLQSHGAQRLVPYLAMAPLVVGVGLAAVSLTVEGIRGPRPFDPGAFLLWAFFGAGVGAMLAIRYFRIERAERWARVGEGVARAHSGTRVETLRQAVHWLDSYWEGEFPAENLVTGPVFSGVAAWALGLPALCWIDPVPISGAQQARVVVLMAVWIPGLSDGGGRAPARTPGLQGTEQALSNMGFTVEMTEAGIVAQARPEVVERWRKRPEDALALAPVLSLLAALASAIGARPVTAQPVASSPVVPSPVG